MVKAGLVLIATILGISIAQAGIGDKLTAMEGWRIVAVKTIDAG